MFSCPEKGHSENIGLSVELHIPGAQVTLAWVVDKHVAFYRWISIVAISPGLRT